MDATTTPGLISLYSGDQDEQFSHFSKLNHVVAIGGGHGLGRVLSSLNHLGDKLTGIVTTTDNGGSTGRLRKSEGCIAWGDLRNCVHQLITEPTIASLMFEYRFGGEGELAKHNLGNLMLLALDNLSTRPLEAVNLIRDMLHVKSHIVPMSESPTHLVAHCNNKQRIVGEISVDQMKSMPSKLTLEPHVQATPEAIEAIRKAQLIIIGPGSFLTSLMPPLLLPEIRDALAQSKAKKIFITNLVRENSPAGKLKHQQLFEWTSQQTGLDLPDAIILHGHKEKQFGRYYFKNVTGNSPNYHNRPLLIDAIKKTYEELMIAQVNALSKKVI